jgi:hypothetical protein
LDLRKKSHWKLVPCVEVTLVSKVSSNLVPRSLRIKVEKKVSGCTRHIRHFYRIYPTRPDISGSRHVCRTVSAATFDVYFECNLLTTSLIDLILLLLAL